MVFVLVHGGRLGGWCWRHVRARLEEAGHRVLTPTLTGVGERAHLARPDVDLDTHIQDVVATLVYEDLWDVTLVAHSYGGLVVTGAAERVPERIGQIVYLDAIAPRAGDSAFSVNSPQVVRRMVELATEHGNGWLVPAPEAVKVLGTDDPSFAWVSARLTGQPLASYVQPIASTAQAESMQRTYIRCTADGNPFPSRFAEAARADGSWGYRELACGHNAMIVAPEMTADALLELVASQAAADVR